MTAFRLKLALLAFVLLPALAAAQTFPTVPSGTVIGRTQFGTGPAQPIPFASITANLCNAFTTTTKGCVPAPTTATGRYLGDDAAWHTFLTQQVVAGAGVSLTGTCSGNSINCTVSATAATQYVVPSRAAAIGSDLSALSVIKTLGYTTAGDGGGATFKNIGTAAFIDSFVSAVSISTPGAGCTNGTYHGNKVTGGSGFGLVGTAVISGNVLTSFTITGTGGNAYVAGDQLTVPLNDGPVAAVPCSTTQPKITVTSLTTPLASFTDSSGTHFQYVVDEGNYINARQFGAKVNWVVATGDAGATNDKTSIQSAMNFAAYGNYQIDGGGFSGHTVIVPRGTAFVCGGLMVPESVVLRGVSQVGTTLKECDVEASSINFITLGDPTARFSCFYNSIRHITLFGANHTISGTVAMVYTNCQQQSIAVLEVTMYPIYRGCVYTETGSGGTAFFRITSMYCVANYQVTPFGVSLNYPNAIQTIDGDTQFTSGSSTWPGPAVIVNTGAVNVIRETYCEEVVTCIQVNVPAANGAMTYIENVAGSGSVTNLVTRNAGSATNQIKASMLSRNGATNTINNAGALTTTNIVADTVF
ncbi:hypothetical protein ACVW1A_007178 [Bradyrhizobium sp. LB1.3]